VVRKVPSGRGSRTTQFPVKSAAGHGTARSTSKTEQRSFIPAGGYNRRTQGSKCFVSGVLSNFLKNEFSKTRAFSDRRLGVGYRRTARRSTQGSDHWPVASMGYANLGEERACS